MTTALELNHVWKKFHRGEYNDCLRDAIPALVKSIFGFGSRKDELAKKDFWALSDIDFKVEEGERLGIIGHNGAGKSTLLKILSQIIAPSRGSMQVNGRLRALIEIGAGFHGDLTGRENIYLNGAILGMTRKQIDRNFDSIVDFAGIEEFLDMPIKRYSSGMAARLGFAVAAHLDPEILIVDEVLSVGDTQFQKKCLGKMNEVAQTGRTVLFVSHNMAAVRQLCSRAILLDHGKMVADGSAFEVVNKYAQVWSKEDAEEQRANRSKRPGDGRARITGFEFGPSLDLMTSTASIDCGQPLFLQVDYESYEEIENPVIQILFNDVGGNVLDVDTYVHPQRLRKFETNGRVLFTIPRCPLGPGDYTVEVNLKYKHSDSVNVSVIDGFSCAGLLNVRKQNIYHYDFSIGFHTKVTTEFFWKEMD